MAHFAEIKDGKVVRVVVVADRDTQDADGNEVEAIGAAYCNWLFGGEWVQTSYNGNIRGKYAGIGDEWDGEQFLPPVPPQPYPSWTLEGREWVPPTPQPGPTFVWYEEIGWLDHASAVDPVAFTLEYTGTELERMKASTDPVVKQLMREVESSKLVVKEHPRTIFGVTYLQDNGYLDHADRKAEILGNA